MSSAAKVISVREFRNESGRILKAVSEGETFTITSNGHPVADLRPHRGAGGPREDVPLDELAALFAALPPIQVDVEGWLRDAREGFEDPTGDDPWTR